MLKVPVQVELGRSFGTKPAAGVTVHTRDSPRSSTVSPAGFWPAVVTVPLPPVTLLVTVTRVAGSTNFTVKPQSDDSAVTV